MGQWTKHFADGSSYRGTDKDIDNKKASWRRSRNRGMVSLELEHEGTRLVIHGPGDFWQSDGYESVYPGPHSQMVCRRIERLIDPADSYLTFRHEKQIGYVAFNSKLSDEIIPIQPSWRNQWFILEYDLKRDVIQYYIKDKRV